MADANPGALMLRACRQHTQKHVAASEHGVLAVTYQAGGMNSLSGHNNYSFNLGCNTSS